jgi:hypothetical protein
MKRALFTLMTLAAAVADQFRGSPAFAGPSDEKEPQWHVNAASIEACSCSLFCPRYFNPIPAWDHCQFNTAIRVKEGNYGDVKLDGMKIWLSGDLASSFGDGAAVIFTFEPGATRSQVDAAVQVLTQIYPLRIQKATIDRAPILWEMGSKTAHAKLGDGRGEVMLTMVEGPNGKPGFLQNLEYWGADRDLGFNLCRSTHHYRGHGLDYSFQNANGFTRAIEAGSAFRQGQADAR